MKKILFTLAIISILSCSKNEEEAVNPLKEKLIGSWRYEGYSDDWIDPVTGSNYHSIENGEIKTFYTNGSFNSLLNGVNYSGDYQITADSLLTINYYNTISGNPYTFTQKIRVLSNSLLKSDCGIIDSNCPTDYHERVITP